MKGLQHASYFYQLAYNLKYLVYHYHYKNYSGNIKGQNATKYYYSEEALIVSSNYWHYGSKEDKTNVKN